jgi:Ni,Fe-hydrogenase I large subunit
MDEKSVHVFPLNRVEGDLKIRVEIDGGVITDAWCTGTMYRGFENIMVGRSPLDSLVVTPRICGICTTAHLAAASKALDMIYNVSIPDNAKRIRNVTLIAEQLQNDVRHTFFLFMCDFTSMAYKGHPLFEESVRRYEALKGTTTAKTIKESKRILEIIAILGGQWPHSSFMVPGGVISVPSSNDITQCRYLLRRFRKWYEDQVLGCSLERWQDVKSKSDLDAWVDESDSQRESDLGFYIRFLREAGMDQIGKGYDNFISFGSLDMPEETGVKSIGDGKHFIPSGFYTDGKCKEFKQEQISEDVSHAWFAGQKNGIHPSKGSTTPYATGSEGERYSWAKAPRYNDLPAETGPLAEMIIASNPLFVDFVKRDGPSVFLRGLARLTRPAKMIPVADLWLKEVSHDKGAFFKDYRKIEDGEGNGLIQAPRGSLGHWIKIKGSKIEKYQIITPTTWNASPRDSNGRRGPCEEALIGTEIRHPGNPVKAEHIIRSFDPCLVCTVHAIDMKEE